MVVVDNCILSSLAKIDRLDLLKKLFNNIETPPSVLKELEEEKIRGFEFVNRIKRLVAFSKEELSENKWLSITALKEEEVALSRKIALQFQVSNIDADCIALAEKRNKILLTDDVYAGKIAQEREVDVFDLKTFLEACVIASLIKSKEEIKQILFDLREKDFYEFSEKDKEELLSLFGS